MKYYFYFVTNVKTQTFYRIVQVFFLLFLGKGESHLSTCVVFRIVPVYVVVFSVEDMRIYMKITLVSNSRFDYIC